MATAAARSPSPAPARPCCAMRRSLDSSPFKLASSPSDSPQRSSACHPSPRSWCGEKENDQRETGSNARAAKVRAGGGAKNFMSPTISATSKAVATAASPRKKVLGERNEQIPVRSSPAEPPQQAKDSQPEALVSAPRPVRLSFEAAPAPAASPVAAHGSRHSFGGEEPRIENLMCKIHHHASPALAASGDAEPFHRPYDPKTNYLSPRPQFLHYKPNPRIEQYRHGGSGVKRLEDSFSSESGEDADTTTEEEFTKEEKEQQQPSSPPNDLPEESSAPAAPSEAGAEAVVAAEAHALQPEPVPCSPPAGVLPMEPAPESSRARVKQRSSLRFLLAPLALVLLMAAAFICVPPPPDSPVMSNTAISKVSEFLSVQELHPVELAAWLKHWSSSSLEMAASYWATLASWQEQEVFGPQFASNLSAAAADADHGDGFYYNTAETRAMPIGEEPFGVNVLQLELMESIQVDVGDTQVIAEPETEMSTADDAAILEESVGFEAQMELEELNDEMADEVTSSNGEEMASLSQDLEIPSESTAEPEQVENLECSEPSLQQDAQTDESNGEHLDGKEQQEEYPGLESEWEMWPGYWEKILKPSAMGAALAAVVVTAVLVFLCMRKKQARVVTNVDATAERRIEQIETESGSGSSEGHLLVKDSQFQGSAVKETERFGDSGASQYSSSLSSGHGRRRKAKEEESLSLDQRSRRESMAYSTSSYGSFTTYEKIPPKKGMKDDEVMTTPVRRSSRLRNQVQSPST